MVIENKIFHGQKSHKERISHHNYAAPLIIIVRCRLQSVRTVVPETKDPKDWTLPQTHYGTVTLCTIDYYILRVAIKAVLWASIPKVARSILTGCSKSCNLQPVLHHAIGGAQGVLPCVGCGV